MWIFFWCLFNLSCLAILFLVPFKVFLKTHFYLLHAFALYGLLDQLHPFLKSPWIWGHQSVFLIWMFFNFMPSKQAIFEKMGFRLGYGGLQVVFLFFTSPF